MDLSTPTAPGEFLPSGTAAPRVLVVTFNRLVPADQGNARRIMQLVRLYKSRGFEVDLLYHNEEGFDPALSHALAAEFGRVNVVRSRAPKHILPGHVCRIVDWYDRGLEAAARDMHRLRGYSVVHVNYVWYSPLLEQFGSDVVKVLDTHDRVVVLNLGRIKANSRAEASERPPIGAAMAGQAEPARTAESDA